MRRSIIFHLPLGLLIALFAATALPGLHDTAAGKNVNKESTRQVCEEDGGTFHEGKDADGNTIYWCDFGNGDVLVCDDFLADLEGTLGCWWQETAPAKTGSGGGHAGNGGQVAIDAAEAAVAETPAECRTTTRFARGVAPDVRSCVMPARTR
jgi:hypothetical protein